MTTHDRYKVIAAAKEAGLDFLVDQASELLGLFYAISFEAGRQAEREEIVKDLLPPITPPKTKAQYIANEIAEALCKAIRARGTK